MSNSYGEHKIRWGVTVGASETVEQVLRKGGELVGLVSQTILSEKIEKVSQKSLKLFAPSFTHNVVLSHDDDSIRASIEVIMSLSPLDADITRSASLGLARRRIINKFLSFNPSPEDS